MENKAEQEWRDKAEKDFDIGLIPASYLLGISDYKQASIEKAMEENIGGGDFDYGLDDGFKKCLELIETVTPSKE